MTAITRQKLSLAFTIYNKARAAAKGDTKKIEQWNKVLGRMVKDAYRYSRKTVMQSNPLFFAQI